ncbi:HAD hydrolase, family IA, variant 3 [Necator americanus]|uniref:HAD hydrolase, family IA, variant 3 n=1 Tax=Necator americanus TaxID=51031 RepID=W2T7R0_NECAM|nr:HAD hydrolase, family IA, variant 3 [Necator americanus]ETN77032.1 HAD hydrolase, family IA, variant 3 [Necator americanus]
MAVTHVIFDFDGLLVDTEACYTIANQTIFRKFGREFTAEHNASVPTAMCSGSRGKTFGPRREPHKEWLDLITLKVFCGDEPEIKRGKPHPDPFLATMNRFAVKPSDPSKVLVFEDALNGGRAAKAAGMNVTQVLHSLEEFRPEEYGLPPFD